MVGEEGAGTLSAAFSLFGMLIMVGEEGVTSAAPESEMEAGEMTGPAAGFVILGTETVEVFTTGGASGAGAGAAGLVILGAETVAVLPADDGAGAGAGAAGFVILGTETVAVLPAGAGAADAGAGATGFGAILA